MKQLQFQFNNGEIWALPVHEVADHRAKYYAKNDKETTYQEEYDFVMNDDYEAVDWFFNQTNPEDFTGKFLKIKDAPKHDINWLIRNDLHKTEMIE